MNDEYKILFVEKPDDPVWTTVGGGIDHFNQQLAGDYKASRVCFVLYAPDNEVVGGVIGDIYWDWFFINLMFVKDELRGRGYGHRLLVLAEDEARKRGARNVYLDTFSFQAPDFYKKYGYQVFGVLPDFPAGHQRYFLTKQL